MSYRIVPLEMSKEMYETLLRSRQYESSADDTYRALLECAPPLDSSLEEALEIAERWKDPQDNAKYGEAGKTIGTLARALLKVCRG